MDGADTMNALDAYEQSSSWTQSDIALLILAAIVLPVVFVWVLRQLPPTE
jgi:predicted DCC family thiol-disulfide oxidoreductase YuxK